VQAVKTTNKEIAEIAVRYNLPNNWAKETEFSFDHLSDVVTQLHESAYSASVKAVNRFATVRNYVISFYIVEYEQHGSDRAKYGDRLLKRLAEKVNKRGINETLLKVARAFYLNYPQIRLYLEGKSPTASDKLIEKSATPSHKSKKGATASHQFITSADTIISQLSFSHIREILTVDDPLARFFYETECMRCCWSVKELRRQISTNLFFRAGISKNPELLLQRTQINNTPALTIKDPFSFEFLDLRPEAFTETDLENALITHLQEFLGSLCLYVHAFSSGHKNSPGFYIERTDRIRHIVLLHDVKNGERAKCCASK